MRMNWMRTSAFALTLGVLSWSPPLQLLAQPGGSSGLGESSGEQGSGLAGGMSGGPSPEYLRAQKEFREKFKGIVHVTHEIRVGNVKAHSQAGLALLIKKSAPEMEVMGGMGGMGGLGYGGMGPGGMGGYLVEYEIVGAKELLRPELRPELAKLVQTLDSQQVSSRYVIRDLVSDAKMQLAFVNFVGEPDIVSIVEKNGVSLLGLAMNNGIILSTTEADLDIQNQVETKELEVVEAPAKSYVPTITKEAKIGSVLVSANGGVGIAITRNGKIETLSGRELFNAYVDLLLLKKKRQNEEDPFGGSASADDPFGDSEPAVAVNDKRNSDPFAADVATKPNSNSNSDPFGSEKSMKWTLSKPSQSSVALPSSDPFAADVTKKSPPSSNPKADSESNIEKRSIDDALVLALTTYKQSKDKTSKEAATLQLKQILRDQFDSLRAVRSAEIDDLRSRLDQLESDEKSKSNRRDEVINERLQQLLNASGSK